MGKGKKHLLIFVIVYSVVALFAIFPRLGSLPLREWDESRNAANAYEMYDGGDLLVTTFDHNPDLWNTKPPFVIWIQALCFSLFGVSEASVRLVSAVAMFLTGLILIFLGHKLNRPLAGFYSAVLVVCSKGLLFYHAGRSGDYDSTMIMFIVLYSALFYLFLHSGKTKYMIFFFIALSFAVLTKGIQSLIPLPVFFVFILYKRKLVCVLKSGQTYAGLLIFLILVGGFYISREIAQEGYLEAVWNNEIGGRYATVVENHAGEPSFYFKALKNNIIPYFFWIFPFAFVFNLFTKDRTSRDLSLFAGITALFYFVIISSAKTKLEWYALPMVPFMLVVIALSFETIHLFIAERKKTVFKVLPFVLFVLFAYKPYAEIVKHVTASKEGEDFKGYYSSVVVMKQIAEREVGLNNINYIKEEFGQLHFFYYYWMQDSGIEVGKKHLNELKEGDTVQVNRPDTMEIIKERFEYEELYSFIQARIIKLGKTKT